jgi:MYXO-CTERM domain-containing protein
VRLVADDGILEASDEVIIELLQNTAPVVDAGPDRNVKLGTDTSLAGVVEDDGLPDGTLTVGWTQLEGPADAVLADAGSPVSAVSFPEVGAYTLELTASDGVLEASDQVTITVVDEDNLPPSVDAGQNLIVEPSGTAQLEGVVEDDGLPDGTLHIEWSQVDGPGETTFANPSDPRTTATFSAEGFYTLRLTADDGVLSASDEVVITVQKDGTGPDDGDKAAGCGCHTNPGATRIPWALLALLGLALMRKAGGT